MQVNGVDTSPEELKYQSRLRALGRIIFNHDTLLTSALLDRLLHHAEVSLIEGKRLRAKDQVETLDLPPPRTSDRGVSPTVLKSPNLNGFHAAANACSLQTLRQRSGISSNRSFNARNDLKPRSNVVIS
jgi:hypothetical protein